jgi:hypothetical protein
MKHLLFAMFALTSVVSSQTPETSSPASDPTVPDAALQQLLLASSGANAANQTPEIVMRGKMISSNGQGLVIIEIDRQIVTVKLGASLTLSGKHSNITLQLTELTREGTSIEVLPLKQTIRLQ